MIKWVSPFLVATSRNRVTKAGRGEFDALSPSFFTPFPNFLSVPAFLMRTRPFNLHSILFFAKLHESLKYKITVTGSSSFAIGHFSSVLLSLPRNLLAVFVQRISFHYIPS